MKKLLLAFILSLIYVPFIAYSQEPFVGCLFIGNKGQPALFIIDRRGFPGLHGNIQHVRNPFRGGKKKLKKQRKKLKKLNKALKRATKKKNSPSKEKKIARLEKKIVNVRDKVQMLQDGAASLAECKSLKTRRELFTLIAPPDFDRNGFDGDLTVKSSEIRAGRGLNIRGGNVTVEGDIFVDSTEGFGVDIFGKKEITITGSLVSKKYRQ